jgi:lipooligosaccharide transport system permease protein
MLAAASMQNGIVESGWPVSHGVSKGGSYRVAITTPLESTDIMFGHMLFMAFRVLTSSASFVVVMVAFGVSRGWWAAATLVRSAIFPAPTVRAMRQRRTGPRWCRGFFS